MGVTRRMQCEDIWWAGGLSVVNLQDMSVWSVFMFMVFLDCIARFKTSQHLVYRPLSRRLDRCDRVIQNESRDPFGGNVYYVTMQIAFLTRKFRNGERNLHCDVVHITTKWVSSLTIDCNGVFAIKAYWVFCRRVQDVILRHGGSIFC